MRKNGFTLIELLIVLAVLIITTVGGKVVWEMKTNPPNPQILTPSPLPSSSPSPFPANSCNAECVNRGFISGRCKVEELYGCTSEEVDIGITFCGGEISYKCCCIGKLQDQSGSQFPCRTAADCPPSLGVCIPGNCPTWKCLSGHCVYFKDANALESCLKEAENLRKRVCEESGAHLDEYGNCVGVDFVKDPYQECYDKYGQ